MRRGLIAGLVLGGLTVLPGAAQAGTQTIGYPGSAQPIGSDCYSGQPCTYFSDGGTSWTIPAAGAIDGFSVDHTAGTGTQQVQLLVLGHASGSSTWAVDAESGLGTLPDTAGTSSFTLNSPITVPQGDQLAVTVVPDSTDLAEGVLVDDFGAGGQSIACEEKAPAAGATFSGGSPCSLGHDDYAVGVAAQLQTSGPFESGGSSGGSGASSGSSGGTIPVYTSTPVAVYKAAEIKFYRATIIDKLPPAPPISQLPASGWGIPVPAHCYTACVAVGTLFGFEMGALLYDASAGMAQPAAVRRQVVLGQVRMTGAGNLRPRIVIAAAWRRALRRVRHSLRVRVVETITDRRFGFVKTRRQTLVLRP